MVKRRAVSDIKGKRAVLPRIAGERVIFPKCQSNLIDLVEGGLMRWRYNNPKISGAALGTLGDLLRVWIK